MNKIKLFFVDLDGTLLDERIEGKKGISQANKDALRRARDRGVQVVISTGRLGNAAEHWLRESGLDYAVTGNGSRIIDKDMKVLKQLEMSIPVMEQIIEFCKEHGLAIKKDEVRIAYGVKNQWHHVIADEMKYEKREDYNIDITKGVKLIIWGYDGKTHRKLAKEMSERIPGISVAIAERGRTIEVTHCDANKGLGNKYIMDMLSIPKDETAHIGDTMNDFPAIDHVGRFIAMGDGAYDLINAAEYIGPDHFNHGVARVLDGDYKKNPYKKT